MSLLQLEWLFVIAVVLEWLAEAQVSFVESPKGEVYIPPPGASVKIVRCTTNASASIEWVHSTFGVLNEVVFNIKRENATSSVMILNGTVITLNPAVLGTLTSTQGSIHCQAGMTNSIDFTFRLGAAPSVVTQPSNTTKNETDVAEFSCTYANTLPETGNASWIFINNSGQMMTLQGETRIVNQQRSVGTVRISPVKRSDAGTYRCVLENEFAIVPSQPAYLIVPYCDGLVTQQAECALGRKFTPSKKVVASGTNVIFDVIACSNPPVHEIHLFFSSSSSNLNRLLGTAIIYPNHVQYTFTADRNWNGNLSSSAKGLVDCGTLIVPVIVLERPYSVNAICIAMCPGTRLQIQWTVSSNGGSDIKNYTIRWGRNPDSSSWNNMTTLSVSDDDNSTQQGGNYTLTGLERGVPYFIEVIATNDIGSTKSDVICNATITVPDKPNVNATPQFVNETRLEICWTVENGGAEILNSNVTWSKFPNFTSEETAHGSRLMEHACMWTGNRKDLTKGTVYYTKVEATNCVGSSIPTVQKFHTLCDPGQPAQLSVVAFHNSAKLMFKAPAFCACCPITGYFVGASDNRRLSFSHVVANQTVTITITGLNRETGYTVRVSAITTISNRSRKGPLSEPVTFNTTKDGASKSKSDLSTTDIVLIVILGGGGGSTLTVIIIIVIVKKKKEEPTDGAPPDTPQKPYAQSKTNVSITVAWTAEDSSGIRHKVQYRKSGSKTWITARKFSDAAGATAVQLVEGLMPLADYEFRVRARNNFGKSDYSEIATLTTLPNDDKDGCDTSPAPFYMTATQQKKDDGRVMAKHTESKEPAVSKTRTSKVGQGPTYIQPEFLREEDRPPARFPQRPVVYSTVDANATQKLYQETKTSKEQTQKTKEGVTYVQPQFLKEEDRPPARFPQRPVVYSQLDAKATQKAREDAELKKLLNEESSIEMGDMPPVNHPKTSSESSSEQDQDGRQQTTL